MTDPNTMPPETIQENIMAPLPVVPQPKTNTVKILVIVTVLMAIALIVLAFLLFKNSSVTPDNNTPTVTPTSAQISATVTPTLEVDASEATPSSTASVSPTNSDQTKKVELTAFHAEIYIPISWNYTYVDVAHGDGGYYFVDGNGQSTFDIVLFDGGIMDSFCSDGSSSNVSIVIGGRTETISNCLVSGQLTLSYGWFNHTTGSGYAYSSENQLSDQYRQILSTIVYVN